VPIPPFILHLSSLFLAIFYTLSFLDYIHEATHLLTLLTLLTYSSTHATHATYTAHPPQATHLHQPTTYSTYNIYTHTHAHTRTHTHIHTYIHRYIRITYTRTYVTYIHITYNIHPLHTYIPTGAAASINPSRTIVAPEASARL